jgi:hypothetical protein
MVSPQPSPAQPSQPSPRPPCLCHPASRCGIPDGGPSYQTTGGIRPDSGGGQDAGPVLRRTRPPSLGSHAPCSSLPLGVSRSLAIMTLASRPSVCRMGEFATGAGHRYAWAAPRGRSQRNVRLFVAALSWVVGLDGSHNTHWEWSGPTPGSLAGRGPDEEGPERQNVTRRAAGRLVERLASIPTSKGAHADSGESGC